MQILISWSGNKSKAVATALREWLPYVFQTVIPWMSAADIGAGQRWGKELSERLEETNFGILCITEESLKAPWLLFEAGALSKSLEESRIVPYLIDVVPENLANSPLSQFQAVTADKKGTKKMLKGISESNKENFQQESVFEQVFEVWWPKLEPKLKNLPIIDTMDEVEPSKTEGGFIQSHGILWKIESIGGVEKYSPYCPECSKKLTRQVDFVTCKNCGFNDIVPNRQPTII